MAKKKGTSREKVTSRTKVTSTRVVSQSQKKKKKKKRRRASRKGVTAPLDVSAEESAATMGSSPAREQEIAPLPDLHRLHERHPGLSPGVCAAYAEAAAVSFARHHRSPTNLEIVTPESGTSRRELSWQPPDERTCRAWANEDDATRDGAYSVSLAAIEAETGLVAHGRAETRTGADYYIGSRNHDDLESSFRLEVSGTARGSVATVKRRLSEKIEQARRGDSALPAIAVVVGFQSAIVHIQHAERVDGD